MAKRLFHSCRSPSAAAVVIPTTKLHQSPVFTPPAGACCPRGPPRRRPLPPESCGARGCAADYSADDLPPAPGTPAYRWLKSSRWHVIEAAASDGEETPRLKIDARRRLRRSRRRRRLHRKAAVASFSSGDSGWFSSDDDPSAYSSRSFGGRAPAETTTLVTSTATETSSGSSGAVATADAEAVAVAGSFAVVKRSDDPRANFRRSMAEMVVGRGIYDADGLERLLRCFLALNDQRHRRDIVDAFGDVWEAVFARPPSHGHGAVASGPAAARRCEAAATSRQ
uniref:Uncharacterized protein n=1 Tax=Avena sativa TaxID=4498 RepID=A0ACD5TVR8_AVESA